MQGFLLRAANWKALERDKICNCGTKKGPTSVSGGYYQLTKLAQLIKEEFNEKKDENDLHSRPKY